MRTNINVRWETLKTQGRGTLCDLSTSGCFVLTGGEVVAQELVRLDLMLSGEVITLWGNVVYSIDEMGFAVRFFFGSEADKRAVESLVLKVITIV